MNRYEFLNLSKKDEIAIVELNRPKKHNAFTIKVFEEVKMCFEELSSDSDVKCIILHGAGKSFCSGLDFSSVNFANEEGIDPARYALKINSEIKFMQSCITSIEKCKKPVISAIHGNCIGLGIDLICCCDIRYSIKYTKFSIKEVDLGLAADLGTLQRLPKIINGTSSWLKEISYTCAFFDGEEALNVGLVNKIFENKEDMLKEAVKTAKIIASKSPVAILSTKHLFNVTRNMTTKDGLNYTANWNSSMLQAEDLQMIAIAMMNKTIPKFSKL